MAMLGCCAEALLLIWFTFWPQTVHLQSGDPAMFHLLTHWTSRISSMRRCSLCKHNLSLIPIRAFLSSQPSLQIPMANMVWFWGNCMGRGWVFLQRSLWFTVDSNRLTLLQGRVDFNARGWLLRNLTFCSDFHVGDGRTSRQCLFFPSSCVRLSCPIAKAKCIFKHGKPISCFKCVDGLLLCLPSSPILQDSVRSGHLALLPHPTPASSCSSGPHRSTFSLFSQQTKGSFPPLGLDTCWSLPGVTFPTSSLFSSFRSQLSSDSPSLAETPPHTPSLPLDVADPRPHPNHSLPSFLVISL